MELNHSIRETGFDKFIVVDGQTGDEISNELCYDKAVDLVRCFENATRLDRGLPLFTAEDLPALRAALAGTDAQDAMGARDAHVWQTCTTGCTPGGRKCSVYTKLWETAHRLSSNWSRAPFATINRWGTRRGHMSMAVALADTGINGGEVITAPAGAYEAEMARRAEDKKAADARLAERVAARKAGGRARKPASRW